MTANPSVREILCFNNQTLLVALNTNKVVSVSYNSTKNVYEEIVLDLQYSIKNLVFVDNCIVAQEIDKYGKYVRLCRFVPKYQNSNEFCKELSTISDCHIILQQNSDGKCLGFNMNEKTFVSFSLKKALLNNLENNPGEIRENLRYINFSYPLLFNGFFMDSDLFSQTYKTSMKIQRKPLAVIF